MRRTGSYRHPESGGEQGFWPSYADMMSAVALILFFLMLLSYIENLVTGNDLQNAQEVLENTRLQVQLTQEQLESLHLLAQSEHLRIGISGLFFQPESFARHYAQARRALELSARLHTDEAVIAYPDYAFYDLLNKTSQGEDLGVCCHPALSILNRYDHANGTDLYRTLETYLLCGGSVKDTAQRLFIHRNSLNYRLERIRELTHADPADTATRFHLEMSYRIDRFIGHNG